MLPPNNGTGLSETGAAESRSPIISSIVTPNLQCAWNRHQTQPSTPQIFLWLFMRFLQNKINKFTWTPLMILSKEMRKTNKNYYYFPFECRARNWYLVGTSFPLHAIIIQQLVRQKNIIKENHFRIFFFQEFVNPSIKISSSTTLCQTLMIPIQQVIKKGP